ncbi:bifunctional 3'-5' exonuclease/DNA polymerase [Kytococcus sedentarius]|uniref:DNA-directed DNA polymerase n=1 Tax=Kytococcus sedentarius (strain ATCC 14392 / DSM 20547 / JCM 11482 / CCUG 33030 / NBRC 15357 / NCTC 11040 / CCM 314 / 541) TaxID=478801 RepID=C7NGI9_KYTSD|nr:bifunctional 3'-5' exonuclease/DNA polymerase [Kytococcus sedentarius]ACV06097.1 DNA polymerase I family protein with 3'-5'-exonuclease and polymerase domains [Kytococcus sedentarius DSM 20547]STX12485.1 DNA polymerase I, thermostable [Kytococcus sedentarius]
MDLVVARRGEVAEVAAVVDGVVGQRWDVPWDEFPGWVAERLPTGAGTGADAVAGAGANGVSVRWVWADSASVHLPLLRAGVRVPRAVDLGLQRAILRSAAAVAHTDYARAPDSVWDEVRAAASLTPAPPADTEVALFDVAAPGPDLEACLAEHRAQQACLAEARDGGRLALLCHAESVGGLIAQELNHAGVPFDASVHHAQLTTALGEADRHGGRPARMAALVARIRETLDAPGLNPDSAPTLVAALRRAGLEVTSTRKWELRGLDHPVIEPLLEYKALARLYTANGWSWMRHWVRDGRFRPDWVAGGVVTGRWASRGGGALQLPQQIRSAVRAEPGWRLVVADAAQLEPRVLAAMSQDGAMARAAAAGDLYQGLVDEGVVDTRAHAKVAMLGAMYGATSGEAGALMARLRRAYPRAMGWVDAAAAAGERGERVSTWLGRTSPAPPAFWREAQAAAQHPDASPAAERRAHSAAREWGRFTRNFVVQGTAAEWALCWMGFLRRGLDDLHGPGGMREGDGGPGGLTASRPELVYFLHDEVIVHAPEEFADEVAECVREAARRAGVLLFPGSPVDFPLSVAVVESYDAAD